MWTVEEEATIGALVNELTGRYRRLTPDLDGPGSERRRSERRPFLSIQAVAPWNQGGAPARLQFRSVQCRDISNHGFSFWIDEPPETEKIVVQLRMGTKSVYLKADVVHVSPNHSGSSHKYIVGCFFLERCDL